MRKLFVRPFVDALGAFRVQRLRDAEHLFQLHVRPIIERIARKFGHDLGVFDKFVVKARAARYVVLFHAAKAHRAPFVMIARQPKLADVRKLRVLPYFVLVEMAVIVDDGQFFDGAVDLFRAVAAKKKVFSEKFLFAHCCSPFIFIVLFLPCGQLTFPKSRPFPQSRSRAKPRAALPPPPRMPRAAIRTYRCFSVRYDRWRHTPRIRKGAARV